LIWLGVGLAFCAGGVLLGFGRWAAPGPGFFPVIIGAALSGLSAVLILAHFGMKKADGEKNGFWREKKSWKRVGAAFLALLFYLIFLNDLGYLLTTLLFMVFLLRFLGQKGWGLSLLVAILSSFSSYWIFHRWLEVALPPGIIRIG